MDEPITCPNCGESNPPDLPYCQNCQWRLHATGDRWDEVSPKAPAAPSSETLGAEKPAEPIPDWLSGLQNSVPTPPSKPRASQPPRDREPPKEDDLLAGLADQHAQQQDVPDWVARIMGLNPATDSLDESPSGFRPAPPPASEEVDLQAAELAQRLGSDEYGPLESLPASDESTSQTDNAEPAEISGEQGGEIYEWLKHLDESGAPRAAPPNRGPIPATRDVPTWVDRMMGVPETASDAAAEPQETVPDWLLESRRHAPPPQPQAEGTDELAASEIHLESSSQSIESDEGVRADSILDVSPVAAQPVVPPVPPEDVERLDVDSLFASMQMPEWLADADPAALGRSDEPPAAALADEDVKPADLPSWVQAMKPSGAPSDAAAPMPVRPPPRPEARGPLLGLHGVLPAIPGAAMPSSRPKAHSMKLEVSEQHRAHAALLEEMLEAEARPLPLKTMRLFGPERILRWGIGAALFFLVGASVLTGSRIFALPSVVPIESNAAIHAVQALPPDAPVLAVFDYEPALAGEVEATAASLMDHLLLLKHPRLAVISTSPVGSALAERLISGVLKDRAYSRGQQYVNLGFLPGGLAGVQLFAQDPSAAVPLGAGADRAWESAVLQGTRRLSDFGAIIVLTDSVEGGRVWIEQTEFARGSSSLIVISSAQAGPMLIPYFDSGQLMGLVSGLNGAAGAEMANGGLPGLVRRYWDAYSFGLYSAAFLLLIGAGVQYWLGLRERRLEAA